MKIANQSVVIYSTNEDAMKKIEEIGRTAYQSAEKIEEGSADRFVNMLITRGHESVLEHATISVKFITDRGVSHEIVRHRLASYTQESTRYCNYSKGKFDGEITVIKPLELDEKSLAYDAWRLSCQMAETAYMNMIKDGATPQIARAVLPTCLKTEIWMTANIREWRHFIKMRTDKAAHPQIRALATDLLYQLADKYPLLFMDLIPQDCKECGL